jgi:hypothetical protein
MRLSYITPALFLISIALVAANAGAAPDRVHPVGLEKSWGRMPLYFIENQGQLDEEVAFYVQGSDKSLHFSPTGITFILGKGKANPECERWILKLDFVDANSVKPRGDEKHEARFSYFKGKQEDWKTGIPTFSKIVYEDLWPGIDLVYSGTVNKLKYEFVVAPGADPKNIRLAYQGATDVSLAETGELAVKTPLGGFQDDKPFAYQDVDGQRVEVVASYALEDQRSEKVFNYGFELGTYDPSKTLILDPAVLVYSGYVGGVGNDEGYDIAVDQLGCAYVTGYTEALETSFPVVTGPDLNHNGGADAFVAKINPEGTGYIYCGYIGGAELDEGHGIAVDADGCAYVTGITESDETTFPVLGGLDQTHNGLEDAFVAKVNAAGTALEYCGYIGGDDYENGSGIAVDADKRAYVTGETRTDNGTFSTITGPDITHNGSADAFVARINAAGTAMDYCGYIGGLWTERGYGIAVDKDQRAYVTGFTYSSENQGFPVVVGPDLTHNGGFYEYDVFVARINSAGTALEYCGYIGGSQHDAGEDIAVDEDGCAYVTGWTGSLEAQGFPVTVGPDLTHNGFYDAFVAKVNSAGTGLDYCGYIGGYGGDYGNGIALDEDKNVYVAGTTSSPQDYFPETGGPDLSFNGGEDGFVVKVNAAGDALDYCGYIGGYHQDGARGIAVDEDGNAYVTGDTRSGDPTFPVIGGPDVTFNYTVDGFVAKVVVADTLQADTYTLSEQGGTVNFSLNASVGNAGRNYLLLCGISGTDPGYPLPGGTATLPLNWDVFTDVVLSLSNTAFFSDFIGTLDGTGQGTAQLNWPGPSLPPGSVGLKLYFAYCLGWPWEYVSNPMEVEIVP